MEVDSPINPPSEEANDVSNINVSDLLDQLSGLKTELSKLKEKQFLFANLSDSNVVHRIRKVDF